MPIYPTKRLLLLAAAIQLVFPAAAVADLLTPNEIVQEITLPGISGELILSFEDATGLASNSLSITTQLITLDPCAVCLRLPQNVFIPPRFPVLVTIEPNLLGLSFRGRWTLEIVTDDLTFTADTPLRLFRSPTAVGAFEDITRSVGFGSFRASGMSGSFSQFLLVNDLRPRGQVVSTKLDRLQAILDDNTNGIDTGVLADLDPLVATARSAFANGDLPGARSAIDDMLDTVIAASGNGIPDVWLPPLKPVSVAGRLRGVLRSLRFSLAVADRARQPGTDGVELALEPAAGLALEVRLSFGEGFDFDLADPSSLGVSAQVIDPADFVARLPAGVFIPSDFPVLLKILPVAEQSFSGFYTIELRTANLSFLGGTPLRLYKAENGGAFQDISLTLGVGSFRASGMSGSFSEFLIASDQRPIDDIVTAKFDRLETFLNDNAGDVPQAVVDAAGLARAAFDGGDAAGAIDHLDDLLAAADDNRETIPAIWRSDGSLVNVFGELLALARTLRLSLVLKKSPIEPDAYDVNRDGQVDVVDVFMIIDRVFGSGAALQE